MKRNKIFQNGTRSNSNAWIGCLLFHLPPIIIKRICHHKGEFDCDLGIDLSAAYLLTDRWLIIYFVFSIHSDDHIFTEI